MKKLMIVALMAIVASTAFAGDSPTLKGILKAKTYDEAEGLLKSGLNQLANPAEKAKAYNKLFTLAMKTVTEEEPKIIQGADPALCYDALYKAFNAASECDKYDVMPNEKGKVEPKFHKENLNKLFPRRVDLIKGGSFFHEKDEKVKGLNFLKLYVDSHDMPLFAEEIAKSEDLNLYNAAFFTSHYAWEIQDYATCAKYAKIAMNDKEFLRPASAYRVNSTLATLTSKQDSINFAKQLERECTENLNDTVSYDVMLNIYEYFEMNDDYIKAVNNRLSIQPDFAPAFIHKGKYYMREANFDEAIASFKKAIEQVEDPDALTYLGACLIDKAAAQEDERASKNKGSVLTQKDKDEIRAMYVEAKDYLERAIAKFPDPNSSLARRAQYFVDETCTYQIEKLK